MRRQLEAQQALAQESLDPAPSNADASARAPARSTKSERSTH
jgi:hypothetical protein